MQRREFLKAAAALAATPFLAGARAKAPANLPADVHYLHWFKRRREGWESGSLLPHLRPLADTPPVCYRAPMPVWTPLDVKIGARYGDVLVPPCWYTASGHDHDLTLRTFWLRLEAEAIKLLQTASRSTGENFAIRPGYEHSFVMPVWHEPDLRMRDGFFTCAAKVGLAILDNRAVIAL